MAFQPASCFALWGCLGATVRDHSPCAERYAFGAWRIATHNELLVTLMAEVTAIVNARPITTIPSDSDEPQPLSPAMLLTMKVQPLSFPPGEFVAADLYSRCHWRRVQYLADQFWVRWKREYVQTLQKRSKWTRPK